MGRVGKERLHVAPSSLEPRPHTLRLSRWTQSRCLKSQTPRPSSMFQSAAQPLHRQDERADVGEASRMRNGTRTRGLDGSTLGEQLVRGKASSEARDKT